MCDLSVTKLCGLHYMLSIIGLKNEVNSEGMLWVNETITLEVFFLVFSENSSALTNDTQAASRISENSCRGSIPYSIRLFKNNVTHIFQLSNLSA